MAALALGATLLAAASGAGASAGAAARPAAGAGPVSVSPWDWPGYGHDAQHTFHGRTTLTQTSVRTLQQAWFFPTGDAVTATPTVVGDTVYVGSWDDYFYAVNLADRDTCAGGSGWPPRTPSRPYPGQRAP